MSLVTETSFTNQRITIYSWVVLFVCLAGYIFDATEMMLYSMALVPITKDFNLTLAQGGMIMTISLLGYAAGSAFWGQYTDKIGRIAVMTWTVALYCIFTGTTALAWDPISLAVSRFLTGFAAGGEWAAGAALVGETWPAKYRGRAIAVMQAGWPLGIVIAALIYWAIAPHFGWRYVFLAGILPGVIVFFIRRTLRESNAFENMKQKRTAILTKSKAELSEEEKELTESPWKVIFSPKYRRWVLLIVIVGTCSMTAYWASMSWLPTYFVQVKGWDIAKSSSWMIIINIAAACGYIVFGDIADRIGRRAALTIFWIAVIIMMPIFIYAVQDSKILLLIAGILGFSYSFFPGFPLWAAELFPTHIRATGFGLSYSTIARILSTLSPYALAKMAEKIGFEKSLALTPSVLIIAIIMVWAIGKETKGVELS